METFNDIKVLVAEDNATNRLIVVKLLSKLGFEADVCEDGEAAVKACCSIQYDLVLMDCMMPNMDGYVATGLIRGGEPASKNIGTPIVALTANAMEGDREKCLQAGMSDYIAKPIRPNDLRSIIAKWTPRGSRVGPVGSATVAASQTTPLVDLSDLKRVFGDSAEELKPLLDAFVESLDLELSSLEQYDASESDLRDLRMHCHTIRGASSNYGAKPLEKLARKIETACIEETRDDAISGLPGLKELIKRTISAANESIA